MSKILDQIKKPNDIKMVPIIDYPRLAEEIRRFLIEKISITGGHLSSNLGAVELTMALHLFLDFPEDSLVWDVGHQAYTHKILTGRMDGFDSLRQYGGLSGFPKRKESLCDSFDTGHSSTSISAALGLAKARDLKGEKNKVVAVIGDGALSGGMAFEALNNAARLKTNMIIILNDNNMSISENVGGMSTYLGKIRTNTKYQGLKEELEGTLKKIPKIGVPLYQKLKRSKDSLKSLVVPGMLFEDMGITYIGPVDGHNMEQLLSAFNSAKKVSHAVIIHVITKKGKGYILAEENPSKFHGVEPFYRRTGEAKEKKTADTYTDVCSKTLLELARKDKRIIAITAAMPSGTGLTAFGEEFPERFFDVGIAEEHAVTFAAGLAAGGVKPVFVVYSTFLQRAYDQILHDVCIENLPVVFAVDRAGIVGCDGDTHQGIFDLSYLTSIPNLTVMAPKNKWELQDMFCFAFQQEGPVAIRYPRGEAYRGMEDLQAPIEMGKSEVLFEEDKVAILSLGSMVKTGFEVRLKLKEKGIPVTLVNMRFAKPLDYVRINEIVKTHDVMITMEENVASGGFSEAISAYLCEKNYNSIKQIAITLPNRFISHGKPEILKKEMGIDVDSIVEKILPKIL